MKFVASIFTLAAALPACAQTTSVQPITTSRPTLPVREVTVFKDGHAFFLHEGSLPVGADGTVEVANEASPVLGTFWPFANGVKLAGVVSSRITTGRERTAQSVRDLLKANTGARVTVIENDKRRYDATILGTPELSSDEKQRLMDAGTGPGVEREEIILLQTSQGVRAAPINSIQNILFKQSPRTRLAADGFDNLFNYKLGWAGQPQQTAKVGMVYLQKGLRWIPAYRVALNGNGSAKVNLRATLVNDIADLQDVDAHLVIGVPSFAFQDQIDPIALQSAFSRVASSLDGGRDDRRFLSNAFQTQVRVGQGLLYDGPSGPTGPADSVPQVGGVEAKEDFFVFDLHDVALKAGARMVIPVAQYDLKYQDIYTLQAPPAPPPSLYSKLNYQQQNEVTSNQSQVSVMHKIRLTNSGIHPLTTAPALIESNGRLLAQTLMTYTAPGGRSDLDLAPAADITVKRSETEIKRTPSALTWRDLKLEQVDVTGKLTITSFRNEPITLELTRPFVGVVNEASHNGVIRKLGAGDDDNPSASRNMPSWWGYGDDYYRQANSLSSVTWTVQVPPKQSVELTYSYNYFWR